MSKLAVMPLKDYQDACDKIREKSGTTDLIESGELADKIESVFTNGFETGLSDGYNQGYNDGYPDGKQANYDLFWDTLQENGNRTNYQYAFSRVWNDDTYNPKYPIVCNSANVYTAEAIFLGSKITDTKVPITISGTRVDTVFQDCTQLKTIRSLTLENIVRFASNAFRNCTSLEELNVYGTIDVDGLNLSFSPLLSHDSLISILNALKDYSTTQYIEDGTWGGITPSEISSTYVFAEGKTLILSLNMNDRQIFDNESRITTEIDVDSVGKRLGVIYETDYWLDNNYTYNVMFYDSSENDPEWNFSMHHYKKHKTTGEIIKFGEDDIFEFNLYGKKGDGTHSITLGATNLAKLTDAEKVQATEKGWKLE